jgi:hypothetical protein
MDIQTWKAPVFTMFLVLGDGMDRGECPLDPCGLPNHLDASATTTAAGKAKQCRQNKEHEEDEE